MTIATRTATLFLGAAALFIALSSGDVHAQETRSAQSQTARAAALRVGKTFKECDSACPEMVVVPAGKISLPPARLGDLADRGLPTMSAGMDAVFDKPFAVSKYPVTVAEYSAFVRDTNRMQNIGCRTWPTGFQWRFDPNASWDHPGFAQSSISPVVCVSWDDARAYVKWLNMRLTGSKDGESGPYRIPTWAEAVYSARADSKTAYFWGEQPSRSHANYGADDCDPCRGVSEGHDRWIETSPVGSFPPNKWGLYDVAGNVYQLTDTNAELMGIHRFRFTFGGSWLSKGSALSLNAQSVDDTVNRSTDTGFRLVRAIDDEHPVVHVTGTASGEVPQPYKWGRHFQDCSDCPVMIAIPPGRFQTKALYDGPLGESLDGGLIEIAIDHPYAIGKFDVTVAQYRAFVRDTGKKDTGGCQILERDKMQWVGKADRSWENTGYPQTDNDPVVCVNWNDASEYVAWLNAKAAHAAAAGSDSPPGLYRLPTGSEWQYAVSGGQRYPAQGSYWGFIASHDYANFGGNPCCTSARLGRDQWDYTSPVGSFPPSAFGLYDAVGNVWQMTSDCWDNRPDQAATYPRHGEPRMTGDCKQHLTWGASFDDEDLGILGDGNPYPLYARNFANGFRVVKALK